MMLREPPARVNVDGTTDLVPRQSSIPSVSPPVVDVSVNGIIAPSPGEIQRKEVVAKSTPATTAVPKHNSNCNHHTSIEFETRRVVAALALLHMSKTENAERKDRTKKWRQIQRLTPEGRERLRKQNKAYEKNRQLILKSLRDQIKEEEQMLIQQRRFGSMQEIALYLRRKHPGRCTKKLLMEMLEELRRLRMNVSFPLSSH